MSKPYYRFGQQQSRQQISDSRYDGRGNFSFRASIGHSTFSSSSSDSDDYAYRPKSKAQRATANNLKNILYHVREEDGKRDHDSSQGSKTQNKKKKNKNTEDGFIAFDFASETDFSADEEKKPKINPNFDPLAMPRPPWVPEHRIYSSPLPAMLHEEILDLVNYLSPTPIEHAIRARLFQRLRDIATEIWSNAEVKVFGSYETNLYLPTSDLDIVILTPSVATLTAKTGRMTYAERQESADERSSVLRALSTFAEKLVKRGVVMRAEDAPADAKCNDGWALEVIKMARIPIIKFVDSVSGYNVDITMNMAGGVAGAETIKQLCTKYQPYCRTMVMLIKKFLWERNLNEVFSGGLGSYAITCMVAFFLKSHPLVNDPQVGANGNLGILFIEFLQLFGNSLNYQDVGISLGGASESSGKSSRDGKRQSHIRFDKHTSKNSDAKETPARFFRKSDHRTLDFASNDHDRLCIEDPVDNSNDVAKQSFKFYIVRKAFMHAWQMLENCIMEWEDRGRRWDSQKIDNLRGVPPPARLRESDGMENGAERPRPETLLGVILRVDNDVVAHRERVKAKFAEEVAAGRMFSIGDNEARGSIHIDSKQTGGNDPIVVDDDNDDFIRVIESDDLEEAQQKPHKRKRQAGMPASESPITSAGRERSEERPFEIESSRSASICSSNSHSSSKHQRLSSSSFKMTEKQKNLKAVHKSSSSTTERSDGEITLVDDAAEKPQKEKRSKETKSKKRKRYTKNPEKQSSE